MSVYIRKGLKYKSRHFAATAEIGEIREAKNEVDIIYTPTDGFSWVEKNSNLQHVKWAFERGDYLEDVIDKTNISIF